MPKTEWWQTLMLATVFAVVLTTILLVVAAVVGRILPYLGRGGRFLAGVLAAFQMNWREGRRFLSERAAAAEEWAAEQRRLRDESRRRAFPVGTVSSSSNDGDVTWYRVTGVHRETEQDIDVIIEAKTAANASAKAELRGIVVTSIEAVGQVPVQQVEPL